MADFNSVHSGAQIDDAVGVVKGAGNGIAVKTGTGAGVRRSIDGTVDEIVVTNADGVSGNPTISLATAVTNNLTLASTALQTLDLDGLTDVAISAPSAGQVLEYDDVSGLWINATSTGGSGIPGGSDTQVQFNDGGSFGGDAEFTYNKTTNELSLGGDLKLDDGASFETVVQSIPATANQVISFPDATGVVALDTATSVRVKSDPTGVSGADQITNMMSLTQAEYDAISASADAGTFYVIVG